MWFCQWCSNNVAIGVIGSYGGCAHHVDDFNIIVVHAISIDQEHSMINISKIKRYVINIDESFWNNMFRYELLKYKERLDANLSCTT
jgi:hypothetical protein